MGIYGNGVVLTEKALDFLWGRQGVTLNNIANVDTPGFKSQHLTFERELASRMQSTGSGPASAARQKQAISGSRAGIQVTRGESSRLDGNNVNMDQEQVDLVRAAYEYQAMVNSFNNDISRLRNAARTF